MSGESNPIRVALLSEQRMLLDALAVRLEMQPRLTVVCIAADGARCVEAVLQSEADAALLDVDLRDGCPFEVAGALREAREKVGIVFLASGVSDLCLGRALLLPANGYLTKNESACSVAEAIERAAAGSFGAFSEDVVRRLKFDRRRKRYMLKRGSPLERMSGPQLQILRHLAEGDTVKEVARKLNLSPKAVDSHKYRIMTKIGVRDRVHLSRYAIREGLIRA